jgi:hypothetical protein
MTRAIHFILSISAAAFLFAASCGECAAQENLRLYAEEGWQIPGLARMLGGRPEKEETLDAAGLKITVRTYRPRAARAYKVLFLSRKDDTEYIHWLSIAPRVVTAYRYKDRLLSVLMDGVVEFAADPRTGAGGTSGEVRLFYEDDDGSGKFQLMVQNLRFDFQPGIPSWAKKLR